MSGAEAVLGILSARGGLLSQSIQLAESAKKLNSFYHSVQNAPKAFKNLERYRQDDSHDAELIDRCIERCRECTAELGVVVEKMSVYMARSGQMGKLYTAFKEQDVVKLWVELEQSKSSLQMAFMLYDAEEQDRRSHIQQGVLLAQSLLLSSVENKIAERVVCDPWDREFHNPQDRLGLAASNPVSDNFQLAQDYKSNFSATKRRQSQQRTRNLRFKIALPMWINGRIWDISLSTAASE